MKTLNYSKVFLTSILALVFLFVSGCSSQKSSSSSPNNEPVGEALNEKDTPEKKIEVDGKLDFKDTTSLRTKEKIVNIEAEFTSETATHLVALRDDDFKVSLKNDSLKITLPLELREGKNIYTFFAEDKSGNRKELNKIAEVVLDTAGPRIFKSCGGNGRPSSDWDEKETEWACVAIGEFKGPSSGNADAPVSGGAGDNLGKLVFSNSELRVDNGVINQKVSVPVSLGTNTYTLEATDNLGNVTKETYPIAWTNANVIQPPAPVIIPPPKEKPKSNCDPNYSGCVPVASDVDCAGGSGNGPAYVRGPVRVIGIDIYDLDRDGDGTACE